ncbi:cAMP-dependent protein kinase catalytic subunit gamma [Manis javanica]|nr:cAMP-dependent protein kinase catalytic subunit gamma [Manis javanica]
MLPGSLGVLPNLQEDGIQVMEWVVLFLNIHGVSKVRSKVMMSKRKFQEAVLLFAVCCIISLEPVGPSRVQTSGMLPKLMQDNEIALELEYLVQIHGYFPNPSSLQHYLQYLPGLIQSISCLQRTVFSKPKVCIFGFQCQLKILSLPVNEGFQCSTGAISEHLPISVNC